MDENLKNKSVLRLMIRGELSQRFFNLIGIGLGLINSFFIITYLSVFEFGLYQLVLAFISVVSILDLDLFDGILTVEIRRHLNTGKDFFAKKLFKEMAFLRILIALIVTVSVFIFSNFITKFYGSDISLFIKIASILLFVKAIQSIEEIFFQSVVSFSYFSLAALREVFKLIVILFLLFSGNLSILWVMVTHVLAEVLGVLFVTMFIFLKKYKKSFGEIVKTKDLGSFSLVKDIFKQNAGHFFARYSMSQILKNSMPWFVKFLINVEAVAYYTLAVNLISFANNLVPMAGLQSVLALKSGNLKEVSNITKRALKYTLWIGLFFLLGGFFIVPKIVIFIFPKYVPAMGVFKIMVFALPLFGAFKILKSVLFVLREQNILTQRLINELLITILGSFILLPTVGVVGTGIIHVSVYLERVIFMYKKLTKKYPSFGLSLNFLFNFDKQDRLFFYDVPSKIKKELLIVFGK